MADAGEQIRDPEVFQAVLDGLEQGVYVVDLNRRIVFWNGAAERISGYLRHEVVGRSCRDDLLVHCDHNGAGLCQKSCPLTEAMTDGRIREAKIYLHHRAGHRVLVQVRVIPVRNRQGQVIGAAESFTDVSVLPDTQRHQMNLAAHGCLDGVTDLPNRDYSQYHLRELQASFEQYGLPFGILLVEASGMAKLRTTRGEKAVQRMLHALAQTLQSTLRPNDFVGRWSEHQFLAAVTDSDATQLQAIAGRIQDMAQTAEIEWWGDKIHCDVAIGTALAEGGMALETLLERAGQALAAQLEQLTASKLIMPTTR